MDTFGIVALEVVFWGGIIYLIRRALRERKHRAQRHADMRSSVSSRADFNVADYLPSEPYSFTAVALDAPNKRLALIVSPSRSDPPSVRIVDKAEIVSIAVIEDRLTVAEVSRQNPFGGAGAMLDRFSDKWNRQGTVQVMILRLTVTLRDAAFHDVVLLREKRRINRLSVEYLSARREAVKWEGIVEGLIRESNPAAFVSGQSPGRAKTSGSVADEIWKLAALRDEGILSPAEFEAQKAKLLRS